MSLCTHYEPSVSAKKAIVMNEFASFVKIVSKSPADTRNAILKLDE